MTKQESLLDRIYEAPPQTGADLRDDGISRAVTNAEDRTPGWSEMALCLLSEFLSSKKTSFLAEEYRLFARAKGLPKPPHDRAFGAIFVTAARRGMITRVGYEATTNPKAHRTPASLWRAV